MFYRDLVQKIWTVDFTFSERNTKEPLEYMEGSAKGKVRFYPLDSVRASYCMDVHSDPILDHFDHCGYIHPLDQGNEILVGSFFCENPAPEDAFFFMGCRGALSDEHPTDFYGYFHLETASVDGGQPQEQVLNMVCEYVRPGFTLGGGDPKLGTVPASPPPQQ